MPDRTVMHRSFSVCLLAALTFVAHGRSLMSGFIWDDDAYVTNNTTLRSLDGLRQIWLEPTSTPQFYPLVHSSYWIEYHLWGLDPAGYHAVNVTLHAVAAVFLWKLLLRLEVPAAWVGAALFAVHPVGVESVSWVTERKNTLSICFALLAAHAWLRYRFDGPGCDLRATVSPRPGRLRWLIIALACFALALFSKTVAAMLVGILVALVWWKTGRVGIADLISLGPLVVIGLPLAACTIWLERHHVGASRLDLQLSAIDRLLIAGRATVFYAGKLLWPYPLAFFYGRWEVDSQIVWQWAYPVVVIGICYFLWARRVAIGRGPFAAAAMYGVALFPALGFIDVFPFKYSFVADHFQYHAMPVLLAAGAAGLFKGLPGYLLRISAGALIGLLTLLSFQRCAVFRDQESLYLDTLSKTPDCAIAAHNLGTWYQIHDRETEAERFLRLGAELARFPDERSRSLTNLAMLALRRDERARAREFATLAVRCRPGARSRAVLALAHARSGELSEADRLIAALSDENLPELQLARAECALLRRDIASALEILSQFVAHESLSARNRALLEAGVVLATHAYASEADAMLDGIAGDERMIAKANINKGISRARRGDLDGARTAFQEAVRSDPSSAEAHGNLGKIFAAQGRSAEAVVEFERSSRLSRGAFAFQRDYEAALRLRSTSSPPKQGTP